MYDVPRYQTRNNTLHEEGRKLIKRYFTIVHTLNCFLLSVSSGLADGSKHIYLRWVHIFSH